MEHLSNITVYPKPFIPGKNYIFPSVRSLKALRFPVHFKYLFVLCRQGYFTAWLLMFIFSFQDCFEMVRASQ